MIEPSAGLPSVTVPKAVASVPSNRPGVTPLSVSVMVSVSPGMASLVTVTVSVPVPVRSASSTDRVSGWPTVVVAMAGVPSAPPGTASFAVTVWVEPSPRSASS